MKMMCLVIVAGTILGCPARLAAQRAQQQPQEVYKILGMSVEGNTLADPAAIIANTGLKIGEEIVIPSEHSLRYQYRHPHGELQCELIDSNADGVEPGLVLTK